MRILITGSEGTIGSILQEEFKDHELTLIDQEEGERNVQADICDLSELLPHFQGVETVIHLAADLRNYLNWNSLVRPNVEGTRNVYEAAARNGVQRVVYASSLNVYPWKEFTATRRKISGDDHTSSQNQYGLTKIVSEAIGLDYHRNHQISVVNLRLGSVNPDDRPCGFSEGKSTEEDYTHWLSKKDCAAIFRASLDYEGYVSIPCCSANKNGLVDLSFLESALGVRPKDSSEKFR